jgi:hypothetical protein
LNYRVDGSFPAIPEKSFPRLEAAMKKGAPIKGPFPLVAVVADYSFTLVSVTMLFLNYSGAVTIRFALLDNRAVMSAIAIPIMAFANSHASPYGPDSHSNIVCQSRRRNGSYGSNYQSVLHSKFLHYEPLVLMKAVIESSRNLSEL